MRPFRFGLFAENVLTRASLFDLARKAEDQRYSTFLIRDHFIAEPFGPQLAPLTTLAAVAGVTRRLRIGSLVLCNDYRHPVQVAKEAATLDVLSEGRLEIGLGAGFSRREYEQAGMRFDPVRVRVERLGEAIRILKGLFTGDAVDFAGTHYELSGLTGFPVPVQRPHPPILIAGTSRRMLALAAAEADVVGFQTVATATGAVVQDPALRLAATVRGKIEELRQLAGARFNDIELNVTASIVVTDNRREEAERFASGRGWTGISADDVLEMPSVFIGSVGTIVAEMLQRRESFGFSYFAIPDRALAAAAPIVSRLAGS
jgi:probable F420-dependent oxidoreductase